MNVPEFLRARGLSILALSNATGIAYSTLHPHVAKGKPVSLPTAKKLEEYSGGEMTAAEILGLTAPPPGTKRRVAPGTRAKGRKAA